MRLNSEEIAAIKELATTCFGTGAVVYLFGSRVDDRQVATGSVGYLLSMTGHETLLRNNVFIAALTAR